MPHADLGVHVDARPPLRCLALAGTLPFLSGYHGDSLAVHLGAECWIPGPRGGWIPGLRVYAGLCPVDLAPAASGEAVSRRRRRQCLRPRSGECGSVAAGRPYHVNRGRHSRAWFRRPAARITPPQSPQVPRTVLVSPPQRTTPAPKPPAESPPSTVNWPNISPAPSPDSPSFGPVGAPGRMYSNTPPWQPNGPAGRDSTMPPVPEQWPDLRPPQNPTGLGR